MQTLNIPSPAQEELERIDYKQFIRAFETHRSGHPEESFNQTLETFLEQEALASRQPELISP